MVAHRGPADRHQQIARHLGHDGRDRRQIIAHRPQADRFAPPGVDHGGQGGGSGVEDLKRPRCGGRLDDLLAGGEQRHPRPAGHRQLGPTRRGGEGQPPGVDPLTGLQKNGSLLEVAAAGPDEGSRRRLRDLDGFPLPAGVFLDDDGVGPIRHGRPGEDADRLAGAQGISEAGARRALADDRQAPRRLGGADGVTVHGRGRERWLVAQGVHRLRQHAADRLGERNRLDHRRTDPRQHPGAGFFDGQKLHGEVQSPEAPPDLALSRTASMTMPFSAALSMS